MVDSAPTDSLDTDESRFEYRPVERWALVALVLGLLSPVALAAPVLWIVPIGGFLAAGVALHKVRRDPGRPGGALALAGLALATFFIVLPTARMASSYFVLAPQARPVAEQYLEYLREGSPEKAVMLQFVPDFRRPLDDKELWLFYRGDAEAKALLRKLVDEPAARLILALGKDAQVRYYSTPIVASEAKRAQVGLWYAITFDQDGQKKSYYVSVFLERKPTTDPRLNPWRVVNFVGGVDPVRTQ